MAVSITPAMTSVATGGSQVFTAAVTGTSNTAVTWSMVGGSGNGTVDATGKFTAPTAVPSPNTVTVQATSQADPTKQGTASVTITAASQPVTQAAATRFLEQSTFGPTQTLVAQVQQSGFAPFLSAQFASNVSTYADPSATDAMNNNQVPTEQAVFTNALSNPDQLRQRVAFALSEIWVTSGFTRSAAGNGALHAPAAAGRLCQLSHIMYDVTLSPAHGPLPEHGEQRQANATLHHANENYARELMQLFTLGLDKLNRGWLAATRQQRQPDPHLHAERTWRRLRAPSPAGPIRRSRGPRCRSTTRRIGLGRWSPFESNHDTSAENAAARKRHGRRRCPLARPRSTDLNGALDNIFAQPSLPPFVCKQLIQHLVTSNPSAAYVKRVADVFVSGTFSGSGATFGSGSAATCRR